jgi:hypothetical protein
LASKAKQLGRKALDEVAQIVRPELILAWHRRLIAMKFDGSKNRSPGKASSTGDPIGALVLQFARESRTWGYGSIDGALLNLGHDVGRSTLARILKKAGIEPAPDRKKGMTWSEFIRRHWNVLAATDWRGFVASRSG